MSKSENLQIRFLHLRTHPSLLAKLDALAERLRDSPDMAHKVAFTRSDAARVAINAGLKALESDFANQQNDNSKGGGK